MCNVYICVCVCVFVYVCIHVCVCVYVCVCVCVFYIFKIFLQGLEIIISRMAYISIIEGTGQCDVGQYGGTFLKGWTLRRNLPNFFYYCCLHFELIVTLLTKQIISKLITSNNELLILSKSENY